jgi:hypothetical protein
VNVSACFYSATVKRREMMVFIATHPNDGLDEAGDDKGFSLSFGEDSAKEKLLELRGAIFQSSAAT